MARVLFIEPSFQSHASALLMAKKQCILSSAWSLILWLDGWILNVGLEGPKELSLFYDLSLHPPLSADPSPG